MLTREVDRSEAELIAAIRHAQRAVIPAYVAGAMLDELWGSLVNLSAPGESPIPAMYRRDTSGG